MINTYNNINSLKKLYNHGYILSNYLTRSCNLLSIGGSSIIYHRKCPSQQRIEKRHISMVSILNYSPNYLQPYLRLIRFDKPIGTWLIYLPCSWSIALSAHAGHLPSLYYLSLFGIGSFLMRGSGCIINDLWDKDIDKKVARTKTRPLAKDDLTILQALCFLGLNLSGALAVLLTFNTLTIKLGFFAMVPVILYPLAKRFTYWPQAILGLTLNIGILLSSTAITGGLYSGYVSLYISSIMWTLIYDTIYSHQDIDDDTLIGVKSTAIRFGEQTKYWLSGFATTMVSGLTITGILCNQTWPYFVGISAVGAHLAWQILSVNLKNGDDCAAKFRSNKNLALVFLLSIIASNLIRDEVDEKNDKRNSINNIIDN